MWTGEQTDNHGDSYTLVYLGHKDHFSSLIFRKGPVFQNIKKNVFVHNDANPTKGSHHCFPELLVLKF